MHDADDAEREISLGTATIVGIFLALALICAAFFGFGYSLGRHSAPPAVAAVAPAETKQDFSGFKAPGSAQPDAASDTQAEEPAAPPVKAAKQPAAVKETTKVAEVAPKPVAVAPTESATPAGQFVVQVSAPSRQGDADALVAALNRKGYKPVIRREAKDSFFHVQIGPFADRKDAQAMLLKLDGDGYKPFIK